MYCLNFDINFFKYFDFDLKFICNLFFIFEVKVFWIISNFIMIKVCFVGVCGF